MRPQLPRVSGEEAVATFERLGYRRVRVHASHLYLEADGRKPLRVPRNTELDQARLRALIREAGISIEEFLDLRRS